MHKSYNKDAINKEIENVKLSKQRVDTKMLESSDSMQKLNMHASARASLNVKRTQKKKKEEDYKKLYFLK